MENKIKLKNNKVGVRVAFFVASGLFVLAVFNLFFTVKTYASDSISNVIKWSTIKDYGGDYRIFDFTYTCSSPDDRIIVLQYKHDTADLYYNVVYTVNVVTGVFDVNPMVDYDVYKYDADDKQIDHQTGTNSCAFSTLVSTIPDSFDTSGVPVYVVPQSFLNDTTKWEQLKADILSGALLPNSGIFDTGGNMYNFDSSYSSDVVTPEIRFIGCNYASDIDKHYIWIKFILPNCNDYSSYFTELWADIPQADDTIRKVCLKNYDTDTLFVLNDVQVTKPGGSGWETINKGSYFEIYTTYEDLLEPFCSIDIWKTNPIYIYLRSAVHPAEGISLVSDYAYSYLTYTEDSIMTVPPINTGNHGNFNEDGRNNNDPVNDKTNDNNNDTDYVGGVTDKPSYGKDSNTDSSFIPSGDWSTDDFASWVRGGFGLTGENGILSFIGKIFSFIPADILNILMWVVVVGAIVAVIKMVF